MRGRGPSRASKLVEEFHETFNLPVHEWPELPNEEVKELRLALIEEEAQELREALEQHDVVAAADALADLLYVTYGAAHTFGIDLDKVLEEVHRANMSKLWTGEEVATLPGPGDGSGEYPFDAFKVAEDAYVVYREDGKVMKPPSVLKAEPLIAQVLRLTEE